MGVREEGRWMYFGRACQVHNRLNKYVNKMNAPDSIFFFFFAYFLRNSPYFTDTHRAVLGEGGLEQCGGE